MSIKLVFFDFDGVFTNGDLIYKDDIINKKYNIKDGMSLNILKNKSPSKKTSKTTFFSKTTTKKNNRNNNETKLKMSIITENLDNIYTNVFYYLILFSKKIKI